jgi:predicted component of type VI protein secretion system
VITSREIKAAVEELNWKEHELSAGTHPEQSSSREGRKAEHLMRIEVRNQGETVAEHFFGPGRIIIGRSPDNEIYIQSKFVSRHHAQLTSDEYGCSIEDLNSTNGVFIGEERIKKHRLKDGDVMSLGIHELVYSDLRAAQSPSALKERQG